MASTESFSEEAMQRFIDQLFGRAQRTYSQGRLGADDDGDGTVAMTVDAQRKVLLLVFPKPTTWLGLDLASAEQLQTYLNAKIEELRNLP